MKHFNLDKCNCVNKHTDCFGEYQTSKCTYTEQDCHIFYHNFEFYLITSNPCMKWKSIDDKENILKYFFKNESNLKSVFKGRYECTDWFKQYRLRNITLKRFIQEVNVIYSRFPNGHKNEWNLSFLTSTIPFIDLIFDQDLLYKNYIKSKKYLENNGFKFLIDSYNGLNKLYKYNRIYTNKNLEIESVKSIDKLVQTINKTIKNEIKN